MNGSITAIENSLKFPLAYESSPKVTIFDSEKFKLLFISLTLALTLLRCLENSTLF